MDVVSNTSPLITLAKADLLSVLPELFNKIYVPRAVSTEIAEGPPDDPIKNKINDLSWIKKVELNPPMTPLASIQLGIGEAEVIEWARLHPQSLAILDDALARKTAKALKVEVIGTLGVIALAYRKKIIPSFVEAVEQIKKSGLYINDDVIKQIAKQLGSS